ncbi:MAG TPA: hypothetical protein VFS67_36880 [Polyangiaceae bacterium]|jgi:hypothetical protein|nr:hypothetical protein [Polyangiaceae bacterium]
MSPPPSSDVRTTGLGLALAALACGAQSGHHPADTSAARPQVSSEATDPPPAVAMSPVIPDPSLGGLEARNGLCLIRELTADDALTAQVAAFQVRHDDFARRTLYSWTTAEQVRELRANPTLLTRAATAEGEPGRAAEVIQLHAESDELAALLAEPRFENKRFGWSNAWATLRGFGGESYGDHLLRITLREQAWLGRLMVGGDGRLDWAFADVAGNPVAASEVLRSPERLAAVYFVDLRGAGCGTLGYIGSAFREYFVCNEAMLESYELYTAEVRAEIERSVSALAGLRQALLDERCSGLESCWPDVALAEWDAALAASPTLGASYLAALAFPSAEYSPTAANLAELLRRLGQLPLEAELAHVYPE